MVVPLDNNNCSSLTFVNLHCKMPVNMLFERSEKLSTFNILQCIFLLLKNRFPFVSAWCGEIRRVLGFC